MQDSQPCIWTIGHSNRSLHDFIGLLHSAEVQQVVDVRRFPGSRKHPHYGQQALAESLAAENISYQHLPGLGGRRHGRRADSPNSAWRVEAFSAYADYMATDEFAEALGKLEELAGQLQTTIMCSEAVPWRCHRRLIADALLVRGWKVLDIVSAKRTTPHKLPPFATVVGQTVTYPGGALF
jgi:uncharacterized protein (DUF488 family)